jgi:GTP cyclohydrolase II
MCIVFVLSHETVHMSKELHKLQYKKQISLKEHFYAALAAGEVSNQYHFPQAKRSGETNELYIQRLVAESAKYQFVKVMFQDQSHYVAFGVPGPIITKYGTFIMIPAEVIGGKWGIHYFLGYPDLETLKKIKDIFIRLDSGCHSGMVLGDITCDCKDQLDKAQKLCIENGSGVIVHIPGHDGRGWGDYKMANQKIMNELDMDTVTAARMFYGNEDSIDQRTYSEAAIILRALGFNEQHSLHLATNNPEKIKAFEELGIPVSKSSSIIAENIHSIAYKNLQAKSKNWNHNLHKKSSKDLLKT